MSARSWMEADPAPADKPAVVDPDGVTWAWKDDVELGVGYHQQLITHHDGPWCTTGSICNEWREIFWSLPPGSRLREATAEEESIWVECWPAEARP